MHVLCVLGLMRFYYRVLIGSVLLTYDPLAREASKLNIINVRVISVALRDPIIGMVLVDPMGQSHKDNTVTAANDMTGSICNLEHRLTRSILYVYYIPWIRSVQANGVS